MRDVEAQVRDYFDSVVERVTAEDVIARSRIAYVRPQPLPPRRKRPVWAMAGAFFATLAVLGGTLALGLVVRATGELAPSRFGAPIDTVVADGNGFVLVAVALTAMAAIGGTYAFVRSRREKIMATTIERSPEIRLETVERTNHRLIGVIVALALAVLALGAWVVYDIATQPDTASNAEIDTALEDYDAAWEGNDRDAFLNATAEGYTFSSSGVTTSRDGQSTAVMVIGSFTVERVGDLVVMGDGPYFVASAERLTWNGDEYTGVSVYRLVDTADGLKVAEHTWVGDI